MGGPAYQLLLLGESEVTVQEWADLNEVSEEPLEYDRKLAVDPKSRLTVSSVLYEPSRQEKFISCSGLVSGIFIWNLSSHLALRFSSCLLVSASSVAIASIMALIPWIIRVDFDMLPYSPWRMVGADNVGDLGLFIEENILECLTCYSEFGGRTCCGEITASRW
ncbi:uncharacterized protein G2W53_003853 [Senna tora]|uniref:Uncharacterized protein n=1 Tax=Senna tora TaxID=362788 RepID=A0A834XAU3_9FABA|nr:uncharacterized protein G2W53_003853 [Senna tora]